MKTIIALCGKSATGKDYTKKLLLNQWPQYFNELISDTTRPPREGEINGVNYNFLTKRKFEENISNGKYLEYACFRGWFYGTDESQLVENKLNLGIFNGIGIRRLILYKNIYNIIPIYLYAPIKVRLMRSYNREHKFKFEYLRRLIVDNRDFRNINNTITEFPYYRILEDKNYQIEQLINWFGSIGLI